MPNDWGLFDILGNVGELVWDGYAAYPVGPVVDPQGSGPIGPYVVWRGGNHGDWNYRARAGYRGQTGSVTKDDTVGFRPARTLPP
jgi:formylglycine-generating enzyme required for sulfatase activity